MRQQYGSTSKWSSNTVSAAAAAGIPPNGRKRTATGTKRVNLSATSGVNMKFGPTGQKETEGETLVYERNIESGAVEDVAEMATNTS